MGWRAVYPPIDALRYVGPLFKDPFGVKARHVIEQAGMKALRREKVQILAQLGIDLEVDLELHGA